MSVDSHVLYGQFFNECLGHTINRPMINSLPVPMTAIRIFQIVSDRLLVQYYLPLVSVGLGINDVHLLHVVSSF